MRLHLLYTVLVPMAPVLLVRQRLSPWLRPSLLPEFSRHLEDS